MKPNDLLEYQRDHYTVPSIKKRRRLLNRLLKRVTYYEYEISEALKEDLDKHEFEAYTTEISFVKSEIILARKKLKSWSKNKRVSTPIVSFGGSSYIKKVPLGQILIMSPWNYPFQLSFVPLISAIAAGNTVVLKTSPFSKKTTVIMKTIINEVFEENIVSIVTTTDENDIEISSSLIKQPFNHIFFTGSTKVGNIIYKEASKNLVPVTLELGGKSPCIVDETANIKQSAKRIVWGKSINSGQTCVAPDYLLVHESIKDELINEMIIIRDKLFSSNMLDSPSYSRIINQKHFDRLLSYLDNQEVLFGGKSDAFSLKLELTLINEPKLNSKVMKNEIFGPILPVYTYSDISEVYNLIDKFKTPLALYLFTKNNKLVEEITTNIPYGGGCINDCLMHLVNSNLPFGGIGTSGINAYHGKYGFDLFTHEKSILSQAKAFDLPFRYPPFKKIILALIKKVM